MATGVYYIVPKTEPLALSDGGSALRYWKELIYQGDFVKKTPDTEIHFSVDAGTLNYWQNTFREMQAAGVAVPVPLEHTDEPDKRRGTVVDVKLSTNNRGLLALYGLIEFADEEAAKLSKTADVSIFVDNEFTTGTGLTFNKAIRHVALTDYPVIPNLGKFESLAASFQEPPTKGTNKMAIRAIADLLKIDPKITDEKELETAVSSAISELMKKVDAAASNPPESKPNNDEPPGNPPNPAPANPPAISASLLGILRDNRTHKLNSLVVAGKITPAVRDGLVSQYCADRVLSLSLQPNAAPDNFDSVVAALDKNETVISFREKSGAQSVALSNPAALKAENNPLIANMERRAAAAK